MTYAKKVRVFTVADHWELEKHVNRFLSEEMTRGFHIIDIQYQVTCTRHDHAVYSCMVYYSEPVEE